MSAVRRNTFLLTCALLFLTCCTTPPRSAPVEQPTTEQPAVTPAPAAPAAAQEFVASEELKKKTFDEVQEVIGALDGIIAASDYDQWLRYLTADYIQARSSDAFLRSASDAAVLKKNGIVLTDLRDYFLNVVVRSHQEATLTDITFVDATHVKAYTQIQGTMYILYYLVQEDGRWKIGVLPSGDS